MKPRPYYIKSLFLAVFTLLFWSNLSAQFTVGGTASALGTNCYRLTNTLNSQAGYVYQNAPLNLNEPFNYKFQVYLGTNNGGADGIVFVLRGALGTPYIGAGGGGMGFLNLTGTNVGGSIGVEVDTWYNGNVGDLTADHIGIMSQGSNSHTAATALAGPIQASATSINVEDGNYHTLNIRWDPDSMIFEVYLDCDYRLQYQGDIITNIFSGDTLVHWGFVGTTGGANNDQRFCFTVPIDSLALPLSDTNICAGEQVQLNAGTSALSYSWSPSAGLSSTTASNPTATPTTSTSYIVEATYLCDTLYDTATINVIQPNFSIVDSIIQPLCNGDCNGQIDLTIAGNSQYAYTWSTGAITEDISSLCIGTYDVTVQDTVDTSGNFNCYVEQTFIVNQPAELVASIINPSKTSCPDGSTCDASATAQAIGGTLPYSYLWSTGEITQVASNMCADSNNVIITDGNGCVDTAIVDIQIPDSIVTTGFGDALICISNSTAITATSTGGTPPFTYVWVKDSLNGSLVSNQTAPLVAPDSTTTYYVYSTDLNGCVGDTSDVLIKVRPPLGIILPELDTICPYDDIDITVQGTGGDSLYTYSWSSGDFGKSITVSPDVPTNYTVTVADACGTPVTSELVFVQVGGYADIKATIDFTDDTLCLGEKTVLTATAVGGHNGPAEFEYAWSHTANTQNIQEVQPQKTRKYIVTISDLCISKPGVDTITVYVGEPEKPILKINPETACESSVTTIQLKYFDERSRYNWSINSEKVNNHQFDTIRRFFEYTGCYDVTLDIETEYGCESITEFPCAVQVFQKPTADFEALSQPSSTEPLVYLQNKSLNATKYLWEIQGSLFDEDSLLSYEFMSVPYDIPVRLIAEHSNGCTDTITRYFTFKEDPVIYLPSSFTPNGDGLNDVYRIVGENLDLDGFEMYIYNRWGEQVFYTSNPDFGWDGTVLKTSQKAPNGVYSYLLRFINQQNEPEVHTGTITISVGGQRKAQLD